MRGRTDSLPYRPISVIPVVSKVFEKIVNDQLDQHLNDNELLSSCQSGVRFLHSTITALLEATNNRSVKGTVSRVAHARLFASRSTHAVISRHYRQVIW